MLCLPQVGRSVSHANHNCCVVSDQTSIDADNNDNVEAQEDGLGHENEASDVKQPDIALSMSISSAIQQHIMEKLSPTASVLPANDVAKELDGIGNTAISLDPQPPEADPAGRFRSSLTLDIGLKEKTT